MPPPSTAEIKISTQPKTNEFVADLATFVADLATFVADLATFVADLALLVAHLATFVAESVPSVARSATFAANVEISGFLKSPFWISPQIFSIFFIFTRE